MKTQATTTQATNANEKKVNAYLANYAIIKGEYTSIFGAYKVIYNVYKENKSAFIGLKVPTIEQLKSDKVLCSEYVDYATKKLNKKSQLSIFRAYQFIYKNREKLAKITK